MKYIDSLSLYFTVRKQNELSTTIFLKGLVLFALGKALTLLSVAETIYTDYNATVPSSLFGKLALLPLLFAEWNINWFLITCIVILIIGLIIKPNYIFNGIFCWMVLNFFMLKFPVTNGSDYVLLVLSILAVPLAAHDSRSAYISILTSSLYNMARILVQIQVILIYLISGWDKLHSEVWRSGEAFDYIRHLDIMFNSGFETLLSSDSGNLLLSWFTIVFETAFGVLVYVKRTRLWALCVGILFHVGIWIMLSLPDFAFIMILSYLIFLKDTDYAFIKRPVKPQPA